MRSAFVFAYSLLMATVCFSQGVPKPSPYDPLAIRTTYEDEHGDFYRNGKRVEFILRKKAILSIEFLDYLRGLPGGASRISYRLQTEDEMEFSRSYDRPALEPPGEKPIPYEGKEFESIAKGIQYKPMYVLVGRFSSPSYEFWLSIPKDYSSGCLLKQVGKREYLLSFEFIANTGQYPAQTVYERIDTSFGFSDFEFLLLDRARNNLKGSYYRGYLPFCDALPKWAGDANSPP